MSQAHDVCEISRQDLILVVGLVACVGAKADDPWATVAVVGGGRVLAGTIERARERGSDSFSCWQGRSLRPRILPSRIPPLLTAQLGQDVSLEGRDAVIAAQGGQLVRKRVRLALQRPGPVVHVDARV